MNVAPQVEISGERITLADLLPQGVPDELRVRAAATDLGRAPLAGSARRIPRREIVRALAGWPEAEQALEIPAEVCLRRYARAITPEEVRAAIRRWIASDDSAALAEIAVWGNPRATARGPLKLEVSESVCDAATGQTIFRLSAADDAHLLPFLVSVKGCEKRAMPAGKGSQVAGGATKPRVRSHRTARAEVLAEPGKPAKVIAEGAGFRLSRDVMPLERGARGQLIRVRALDTRRVISARVTGPGLLQAE